MVVNGVIYHSRVSGRWFCTQTKLILGFELEKIHFIEK